MEEQVLSIFAVTNGFLDKLPTDKFTDYEAGLQNFVKTSHPAILETISKEKTLSDDTKTAMSKAIEEFNKEFMN